MADDQQRHRRLRLLTKHLNKDRKQQAKQIDILCNDFIAAQKDFIKKLNVITFTASFYESIIGITDLNSLLYTAVRLIQEKIDDASVTFFLRQAENFELHIFESDKPITLEKQHIENCFTPELMDNICESNKVCSLQDMFAMGLQGNLVALNKVSAVTVPLTCPGSSPGFILVYRSSQNKLTADDLKDICAVTSGLSRAIQSCRGLLHPAD
jgi:transcriptional regulator with GAF, ATPase, and Fis domain